MSRWQEDFNSRVFRQKKFKAFVEEIDSFNLPGATPGIVEELSRIKRAIPYIEEKLSSINPELVSEGVMANTDNLFDAIMAHFNNFKQNRSISELKQANKYIDSILKIIPSLFIFDNKNSKASLANIIKSYEYKIAALTNEQEEKFQSLRKEKYYLNKELDEIAEKLKIVNEQIESKLVDFSNVFDEKQKERQDAFDEKQKERQDDSNEKQKERQDVFNEKEKERQDVFNEKEKERQDVFNEKEKERQDSINNIKQKFKEKFDNFSNNALEKLEELKKIKKDAEEVFGVVQGTAQAGAHKENSDKQKRIANWFRGSAIGCLVLAIIIVGGLELYNYFSDGYSYDLEKISGRFLISIVFFALAVYLSRESSKHRRNENRYRDKELVLRTIDSYLSLIKDESKKDELKIKIAETVFSNDSNSSSEQDVPEILSEVVKIIKQIKKE